ncbi:hypothetical protein E2C01_002166 [Portunus trituberculatus]|uniref:Uncharacterized protein n=1 Tax=Portunus trituberculatus TaxID=210409 RepID=A0A5B7CL71_PORTR|nr:hypothetical protein [Portunus trituberculatus]
MTIPRAALLPQHGLIGGPSKFWGRGDCDSIKATTTTSQFYLTRLQRGAGWAGGGGSLLCPTLAPSAQVLSRGCRWVRRLGDA